MSLVALIQLFHLALFLRTMCIDTRAVIHSLHYRVGILLGDYTVMYVFIFSWLFVLVPLGAIMKNLLQTSL